MRNFILLVILMGSFNLFGQMNGPGEINFAGTAIPGMLGPNFNSAGGDVSGSSGKWDSDGVWMDIDPFYNPVGYGGSWSIFTPYANLSSCTATSGGVYECNDDVRIVLSNGNFQSFTLETKWNFTSQNIPFNPYLEIEGFLDDNTSNSTTVTISVSNDGANYDNLHTVSSTVGVGLGNVPFNLVYDLISSQTTEPLQVGTYYVRLSFVGSFKDSNPTDDSFLRKIAIRDGGGVLPLDGIHITSYLDFAGCGGSDGGGWYTVEFDTYNEDGASCFAVELSEDGNNWSYTDTWIGIPYNSAFVFPSLGVGDNSYSVDFYVPPYLVCDENPLVYLRVVAWDACNCQELFESGNYPNCGAPNDRSEVHASVHYDDCCNDVEGGVSTSFNANTPLNVIELSNHKWQITNNSEQQIVIVVTNLESGMIDKVTLDANQVFITDYSSDHIVINDLLGNVIQYKSTDRK